MTDVPESVDKPPSGVFVRLGPEIYKLTDPRSVQPVSADIWVRADEHNGIVRLEFATMIVMPTLGEKADVHFEVCSRLRLSLPTALDLRNALDAALAKTVPVKREVN